METDVTKPKHTQSDDKQSPIPAPIEQDQSPEHSDDDENGIEFVLAVDDLQSVISY